MAFVPLLALSVCLSNVRQRCLLHTCLLRLHSDRTEPRCSHNMVALLENSDDLEKHYIRNVFCSLPGCISGFKTYFAFVAFINDHHEQEGR